MKTLRNRLSVLGFVVFLSIASIAEARIGGGRSTGSRGFRGFGSRTYQTGPSRSYPQMPNSSQPQQAPRPLFGNSSPNPAGSGGFMRGLMGGLAGGFLGSMLFRNLGHAGMGMPGLGGMGIFDILLIAAIGFFLFRLLANKKQMAGNSYADTDHYEKLRRVEPGPFAPSAPFQAGSTQGSFEESNVAKLRTFDSSFDLVRFKDERMDDFLKLQSAWNHRDLSSVAQLVGPELRKQLDSDIADLKNSRKINRIENIAVRGTELVDVWQEYGQEFATLRFRANLTDFTVDETSGSVVAGDPAQPVKFEEDWTFVRPNTGAIGSPWTLSAIEA